MNENGTSQMQNNTRGEKGAEEKKCGNECMVVFHFHRSTLINKSFHTKVQIQGLNECIHAYMYVEWAVDVLYVGMCDAAI